MIMLDLSKGSPSDGGLSDGKVIKSDRIDGILARGLLVLTLGLAVGIDGDLGKGTYGGEICGAANRKATKAHCSRNLGGQQRWPLEKPYKSEKDPSRMADVMGDIWRVSRSKRLVLPPSWTTKLATRGSGP
jgi:hypothetical protein